MPIKESDSRRTPERLREKLALAFTTELEASYQEYHYARLKERVPAIGWSSLLIFLVYALFDVWAITETLSFISVFLRLAVVCPLILAVLWAVHNHWSYKAFILLYSASFTIACLTITAIIFLAQVMNTYLPYQGLLLMVLFGYFLMSMPTVLVTAICVIVSIIYLAAEAAFSMDKLAFGYQCIFFSTANAMGFVGCLVQERNMRTSFLTERQLEHSRQRLLEESSRKTLMLASASHDLKQPLLAISLLVDDLENKAANGQPRGSLEKLRNSIQHLGKLTDSLMEATQLDSGGIQPKIDSVNLAKLIHTFTREYSTRLEQQGIQLITDIPPATWVDTDPLLLSRVMRNLMDNAIKHGKPSQVFITVEIQSRQASIEIRDNGKGIASNDQSAIFSPFYRLSNQTAGLGLGLSIVKQLCELLSIPVTLDSAPGMGTCFKLCIPLTQGSMEPVGILRVLLGTTTSDPDDLSVPSALLKRWNIEFTDTTSASPDSEPPNLLMLFGNRLDCFGDIARLRQRFSLANDIPVILLTPQLAKDAPMPETKLPGALAGNTAVQYLTLPLKPARLRLMLGQLCAEQNLQMTRFQPDQATEPF
jgi:signal transduction histidine kinase